MRRFWLVVPLLAFFASVNGVEAQNQGHAKNPTKKGTTVGVSGLTVNSVGQIETLRGPSMLKWGCGYPQTGSCSSGSIALQVSLVLEGGWSVASCNYTVRVWQDCTDATVWTLAKNDGQEGVPGLKRQLLTPLFC